MAKPTDPQPPQQTPADTPEPHQPLGVGAMLLSILAAAIGVQSGRNRERDFVRGRALTYIISGVVFTTLFIATLVMLVNFILRNTG